MHGVFYRSSARKRAEELGLTGWVRNLPDGRVEVVVEGEEQKTEEFLGWCRRGPPAARVDDLKIEEEKPTDEFSAFDIR